MSDVYVRLIYKQLLPNITYSYFAHGKASQFELHSINDKKVTVNELKTLIVIFDIQML